jgi:hypothetical protein
MCICADRSLRAELPALFPDLSSPRRTRLPKTASTPVAATQPADAKAHPANPTERNRTWYTVAPAKTER